MTTLTQWLEAEDNAELCNSAGDLAFDAISGYFNARDQAVPVTSETCRSDAEEIAYARRKGWRYAAYDTGDPAGEIACLVLAKHGFAVRSGSIGFDATIKPVDA